MSSLNKAVVIGTGVLGAQVMMQAAYAGKTVTGYDNSQEFLNALPERIAAIRRGYEQDLPDFDGPRFDAATQAVISTTSLEEALKDADIVIESIPESLELKQQVWAEIGKHSPDHTIFTTNTSSLRPSDFAEATGRPEKFLALHFANHIWLHNTAEVMKTPSTGDEAFHQVLEFAAEINMEPIPVLKEVPGYILNSLLIPFLQTGSELFMNGVGKPADIDQVWRAATGSPRAPLKSTIPSWALV